ncbi:MAG: SipW-dependent-type signal peptide-containing protein, partial [Candidatus Moranbacteria bacterium]|nr:SipW-dependent-type signal peptide-containing protein [Candidatus Moranbacteria bacterium]
MNKKIVMSLSVIAAVAAIAVGGTMALFSDTETSNGNIFTAGSIDLKVDHTKATYDGQPCVGNCVETGSNLIQNGDFESPVVTSNGGQWQRYAESDSAVTKWHITSGSGLELQRNGVAGAPHGGVQLAELDSDQPNSQSGISQDVVTVPGGHYRLHFWYSPRPGNGPSGDNAIDYLVK